jgi:hypothetical protein
MHFDTRPGPRTRLGHEQRREGSDLLRTCSTCSRTTIPERVLRAIALEHHAAPERATNISSDTHIGRLEISTSPHSQTERGTSRRTRAATSTSRWRKARRRRSQFQLAWTRAHAALVRGHRRSLRRAAQAPRLRAHDTREEPQRSRSVRGRRGARARTQGECGAARARITGARGSHENAREGDVDAFEHTIPENNLSARRAHEGGAARTRTLGERGLARITSAREAPEGDEDAFEHTMLRATSALAERNRVARRARAPRASAKPARAARTRATRTFSSTRSRR